MATPNTCYDAVVRGNIERLKLLWSIRDTSFNYLCTAMYYGHHEIAKWIIERDPSYVHVVRNDYNECTPLMECRTSKGLLLLLEHNVDIHAKTINGGTALHLICLWDTNVDILPLLARGANEREKDNFGKTPLDHAKTSKHPQLHAMKNFRGLMILAHARATRGLPRPKRQRRRRQCKEMITLSSDHLRLLRTFLY